MNKNYNLKLDLKFNCNNPTMEFDKFDNDTSSFLITITNDGKLVDIKNAIVVLVAIKPSGNVESQFMEIENNCVYANLKPSMKDEVGEYTARAMLILGNKKDIVKYIRYTVSEDDAFSLLNDSVKDDEDFTLLTNMFSRLSTIETNEKTRVANEVDRLELQNKLEQLIQEVEKSEVDRKAHEVDREKLHLEMEDVLNEAKTINTNSKSINNVSNELITSMKSLNDNVLNAYNDVVEATKEIEIIENEVSENEAERQKFYGNSKIIIQNVENSEESRQLNEDTRIANEKSRELKVGNYEARYEKLITDTDNLKNSFNEFNSQANSNEEARVQAESERKNRYNQFESDYNTLRDNINNQLQETNQTKNALINELNQSKSDLTNTVRNEITSQTEKVNNKITEIDNIKNQMVYHATNATNEANKLAGVAESVINEVNNVKVGITNNVNTVLTSKVNEVNQTKSDLTNTVNTKINEIVNTFNSLTSEQQQDAEVITARDGEISLKARLDRDLERGKETFIDVEGSYITTDSNEGYLKNIEILGNTIQDSNNLADIRSVGDKMENQDLYKIDVVSCGKNLFKMCKDNEIHRNSYNGIIEIQHTGFSLTDTRNGDMAGFIVRCNPNTPYIVSFNDASSTKFLKIFRTYTNYPTDSNADYNLNISTTNGSNITLTTTDKCSYIFFGAYGSNGTTTIKDIQIEEGNTVTEYEPYQEYKLEIFSSVQLEKVGDVADRIVCKDGVWGVEKNIKDFIIPTNLTWYNYSSNIPPGAIGSYCSVDLSDFNIIVKNENYSAISNRNVVLRGGSVSGLSEVGMFLRPDTNIIYIKDNVTTLDDIKLKYEGSLIKYPTNNPDFIPLPNDQQIKLKSFSGKTNISFLTETEGTIKGQVSKSIGATINTHTAQIDNLNKELERIKKLEESKVSTVETESNFTTVEETSNGYFEDIKLEGKTLVVNSKNEKVEPGTNGATLKSVGQDVDEIVIESINSNLFDENSLNKYIISSDEDSFTLNYETMYINNFMYPIKSKGQHIFRYTCKETVGNKNPTFCFIYKDGSVDYINTKTTSEFVTYEKASNVNKELIGIKSIYYGNGGNWVIKKNSIMLSKGIESKPYVHYESDKKTLLYYNTESQTWEKPILREWDTVEKHSDGKYYYHQRSGEIILNGSENWILSDDTLTNTIRFIVGSYLPGQAKVNAMFLCDTLSFDKAWYDKDVEGYTITNSSGHIYIRINRSRLSTQDVAGFKVWLQANPTTLLYQLAEEKIYECTNIDLITYENETNYIVESGAITPKSTIKVHNNISNIVRLLQSKVSMLENNMTDYMVTQNRLLLTNRYSTDNVGFTVDTATFSLDDSVPQYDNDLYNLILNNILVGKENYNRDYMESLINFYWMTFAISDEMYFTLSSIIEEQYTEQENMPIEESPTE